MCSHCTYKLPLFDRNMILCWLGIQDSNSLSKGKIRLHTQNSCKDLNIPDSPIDNVNRFCCRSPLRMLIQGRSMNNKLFDKGISLQHNLCTDIQQVLCIRCKKHGTNHSGQLYLNIYPQGIFPRIDCCDPFWNFRNSSGIGLNFHQNMSDNLRSKIHMLKHLCLLCL